MTQLTSRQSKLLADYNALPCHYARYSVRKNRFHIAGSVWSVAQGIAIMQRELEAYPVRIAKYSA